MGQNIQIQENELKYFVSIHTRQATRNIMRLGMNEEKKQINKLSMLAQESCLMDHKSEV